jgi:serine/threonine protein kinase
MKYLKETNPASYAKAKSWPSNLANKANAASQKYKAVAAQRKQIRAQARAQKQQDKANHQAEKAQEKAQKTQEQEQKKLAGQKQKEKDELRQKTEAAQAEYKRKMAKARKAAEPSPTLTPPVQPQPAPDPQSTTASKAASNPPPASTPPQVKQKVKTKENVMEGLLKIGAKLNSDSGTTYEVKKLLGAGGQGEVYHVVSNGKDYALKWYFKKSATRVQKNILDNLVKKGEPDSSFLWPKDLINQSSESFGYIMPLRPPAYKSIVDLMKRRAEPSFYALCRAAYKLTQGYQKLHSMGFSYRDISFGNLFFEPNTGDVLICDNDNVAANDAGSGVYGTPRFMAPEIVVGKAKPSRNTDLFSLAVLLFYMFMLNHPLEGKLEANIKCMDMFAMNKLYGTNPVFIFDPNDKSNEPLPGYQDNAIIYWALYPWPLKELFLQSFTVGLTQPNRRVTENQWLDAFANLMSCIIKCPACGVEVFYDESKVKASVAHTCWNCKNAITVPPSIVIGRSRILITPDARLRSHQTNGDYDMATVAGTVVQNPNNPNHWGIRNDSSENWTYIKADGTQVPVAPGRSAAIAKNSKIDFGQLTGAFE